MIACWWASGTMDQTFIGNGQSDVSSSPGEPLLLGTAAGKTKDINVFRGVSLAGPGETAIAADDSCSTISNSAATRAASRVWSGFSQAGAAPRGRARTVRRLLQSYASTSQRRCPIWNPATGRVISPVVAPALCTKPRDVLTINQATKVDVLKQGPHEFATMRSLAMRFRGILRGL